MTFVRGPARRVVVFSGHRIDATGRARPRFPAAIADRIGARIGEALATIDLGAGDLALTQGAAGGDLLFAEAALHRGARLRLLLPLELAEFIARSILPVAGGEAWRDRFADVLHRIGDDACLEAPVVLGAVAAGDDAFERANRWLLDEAFAAAAPDDVPEALCLWDGRRGDGPGGTGHFVAEASRRGARVTCIDPARI